MTHDERVALLAYHRVRQRHEARAAGRRVPPVAHIDALDQAARRANLRWWEQTGSSKAAIDWWLDPAA